MTKKSIKKYYIRRDLKNKEKIRMNHTYAGLIMITISELLLFHSQKYNNEYQIVLIF